MNNELLNKLQCPMCKSDCLELEVVNPTVMQYCNGKLTCLNCGEAYPIVKGIIILVPKKYRQYLNSSNWDKIYELGIKGDFTRGIDKLTNILKNILDNKKVLYMQYPLIELAKKFCKHNSTIEIGCGTGTFSLLFKKLEIAKNLYLVDTSLPALKTAQKLFQIFNESAYFILADGMNLPFKNSSFDISFSGGLIEHFEGKKQQKIVSEHCRVATGILCEFPVDSPAYWLQRYIITLISGEWPFGYEKPLSYQEAKVLFKKAGYDIVTTSYHDSITAAIFKLSNKYNWIKPFKEKNFLNRLFWTDIVIYGEKCSI